MTVSRRSPAVLAFLLALTACTSSPDDIQHTPPVPPAEGLRLVSYDSCPGLYDTLRASAAARVGPFGFPDDEVSLPAADVAREGAAMVPDAGAAPDAFSGTNTHERGVDEPDLIKTDGRRIVTVAVRGGVPVLRVIDAASRAQTGELALTDAYGASELLLAGDRALVLAATDSPVSIPNGFAEDTRGWPAPPRSRLDLRLIDLSSAPRQIGRYAMDGSLVDARQNGSTARVVVRSSPRIDFPLDKPDADVNRRIVEGAGDGVWLPHFEVTAPDGSVRTGTVPCERVSRPASYDGVRMLTMLSFDLAGGTALSDGVPVTVVADGDTVYGTGTSLYVADGGADRTEIYRFDTGGAGPPRYAASGAVPGRLLNQYALSEWNGSLRAATTVAARDAGSVTVLTQRGTALAVTGSVGDLGRGETIHSVRFLEDRGYVVTFRRTDPLYALDLRDPARPVVTGELKIPGYSAYLHPAATGRLIGVGQDATAEGTVTGLQVSLFDVSDPAAPARLAQHRLPASSSAAEFDPHAFLFWPATGHLVVPVAEHSGAAPTALVLRLSGDTVTEAGTLAHPDGSPITRSLVIGDTLWTAGPGGLRAVSLATLQGLAWLPI
ncbi:putative secreted protein with C-terminal beta-propeller domain [Catenuloplanes nepalensis]|uniref:Secreted protein with C-terminal beta-propeller domain n=1 Tax=Catenuloplanes nepalensis TaxID=587533 RepID=A0ABT9N4G2_9ACTN|nr:beta-propeller domain-containing protein [Catenuloplanes nepalensis]MDP9798562.1 putative secreted protein with C-terminal beta-propeller domain [Catenuloplanes nepalensis]